MEEGNLENKKEVFFREEGSIIIERIEELLECPR